MRVFLSILLVILFAGCEKYEQPSSLLQQISGVTPFTLKSYRITILSGDVGTFVDVDKTEQSDYVGLCDWYVKDTINGRYVITSDTTNVIPQRKYVIGDQWNFGDPSINGLTIYDNLRSRIKGVCRVYEGSSPSIHTYSNMLDIIDERTNTPDYGFSGSTNSRGVAYATELILTTPIQWAFIKDGQRIIGRFNYRIDLTFGRN